MNNPDWGPRTYWQDNHGENPQIPMGVYMWQKPGPAYMYQQRMETARDTPMDIWRIPGEHPAYEDPDVPMARWTPGPVRPELFEGPEHRQQRDTIEQLPYEQYWNNYKPLGLNAEKNPNYEDLWNQRVGPE
jgi:hypothetical protein